MKDAPIIVPEYEMDAPLDSLTPEQLADNAVTLVHSIASYTVDLDSLDPGPAREESIGFLNEDKDRLQAIFQRLFVKVLG